MRHILSFQVGVNLLFSVMDFDVGCCFMVVVVVAGDKVLVMNDCNGIVAS